MGVTSLFALATIGTQTGKVMAADEPVSYLDPLYARTAQTAPKITLNGTFRYFNGMELQEADRFDGYTTDAELIVPFLERFQVRLFYPFYTEGRARSINPATPSFGHRIKIYGAGGTFDFPSVNLDFQFIKGSQPADWKAAASLGYGDAITRLTTTAPNLTFTNLHDFYNHQGAAVIVGLKADKNLSPDWTLFLNAGGQFYLTSDDIHPKGSDTFFLFDSRTAVSYNSLSKYLVPVAELVYRGDFSSYNTVSIIPELVVLPCAHFQLKAGFPIGIADGQRWGATVQAAFSF